MNFWDQTRARFHRVSWPSLVLGAVVGIVLFGMLGMFVMGPAALSHHSEFPLEHQLGGMAVSIAAGLQAGNASNPLSSNRRTLESGRIAYVGSCGQCHGARGDGKGEWGQAIFPQATSLIGEEATEKSDATLFWIIKNGLSFTAMPGFSKQYSDQNIWALVTYLRALQNGDNTAFSVPTATPDQLALADVSGGQAMRGAAIYFAAGCQQCHGPIGNASGELRLHNGEDEGVEAIRYGRRGMPAYSSDQISNSDLTDLLACLDTLSGQQRSSGLSQQQDFER